MVRIINGIEIPEDFDGIDDAIALGMMKDNGLISDQQKEVEVTTVVEPTEKEADESPESTEVKTETTTGAAPVKEQENGEKTDELPDDVNADDKTVPYQAMLAERNKRKKEQRTNEALQAEIAQLRAQYANSGQVQQPVVTTQPPMEEKAAEQNPNNKKAYFDYIKNSARELFVAEFGREPDSLDDDDPIILASYVADVKDGIKEYQNQQKQIAEKTASEIKQTNQTWQQFVSEQKAKDEYDEIESAFVNEVESLPPDEQEIIKASLRQCFEGKGTPHDVYTIKKAWNDVVKTLKPLKTQEVPKVIVPPKPAQTAEQKLEQIEKHPKTNLVGGTNSLKPTGIDEVARLMNEMPWAEFEKKHPEYAKLVLEG